MSDLAPLVWHTEQRRVRDLIPYDINPRQLTKDQHVQLTASLTKFGVADIPVLNTDNRIVGGHQRTRIMVELGMADDLIDVRVPNRPLTVDEFKELCIRLNKNSGQWDFDVLANQFEVPDLIAWGFTEMELGMGMDATPDAEEPGDKPPKVHTCPSCSFQFKD